MPRHSEATLAAIKQAVDIVALVGEYLPLHRSGSKTKALCPFHDDHNPSLELNAERQSFKCWSCGAGGDVFDFVKDYLRVDFPEALRMLADRAGVALENPSAGSTPKGASRAEMLAVNDWAERTYAEALAKAPEVLSYAEGRGIDRGSIERFRLGYAPDARDWLASRARRQGFSTELLERAGLIVRSKESPALTRERFRGRLMFPIHDPRGRTLGFGGRILPQAERTLEAAGKRVAKYLNTAETPLFQKRKVLYAADLAFKAAREAGWVAVVEGYTDVIAAHQVGIANVVGTLGTALGDEHILGLRRLAARVVLVFDGDEAGQSAADRALELFLGHEVDVRVLSLPSNLDPCDFLLKEGAAPFRERVDHAVDPLDFAIDRAAERFDINALDGAQQAAEWILAILARAPRLNRVGITVKVGQALNRLSDRLRLPVKDRTLASRLQEILRQQGGARRAEAAPRREGGTPPPSPPIRPTDLDAIDREFVTVVLNQPDVVARVISRVAVSSIRDAPLRAILQASYDLHAEGETPTSERVMLRLDDPALRALVAGLLLPTDRSPMPERVQPARWEDRLAGLLARLAERDWQDRLRDLKGELDEIDETSDPQQYRALQIEYRRLLNLRPDTKRTHAS